MHTMIIKKATGVALCLAGGYLVLYELAVGTSESYLLRDVNLKILFFLFLSLGIGMLLAGVKLLLSGKKKKT